MTLVANWKSAWRWHSTQVLAILAILPLVWAETPDEVKAMIPVEYHGWIVTAMALIGVVLRMRDQTKGSAT